jgi:condensin complex subunit 2
MTTKIREGSSEDEPRQAPRRSSLAPVKETLDNEALSDLYSMCINMSTANKITAKNAFSLNLIEHMDDVLRGGGSSSSARTGAKASALATNFQKASCTVEASVKIYCSRVDAVHTETYQVLGGLSRQEEKKSTRKKGGDDDSDSDSDDEEDDDDDDDETRVARKRARAKQRRRAGVSTLESNITALNLKKIDVEFEVDPTFRATSAAFDEGGARGLLLNNLELASGSNLQFDGDTEKAAASSCLASAVFSGDRSGSGPLAELQAMVAATVLDGVSLQEELHEYVEGNDGSTQSVPGPASDVALAADLAAAAHEAAVAATSPSDPAAGDMEVDDQPEFGGGFVDDGDDGGVDMGGDDDDDDGADEAAVSAPPLAAAMTLVSNTAAGGTGANDFQFFDPTLLQEDSGTGLEWAGVSHWQFRSARSAITDGPTQSDTPSSTASGTTSTSRAKAKVAILDFDTPLDEAVVAKAFARAKPTTITMTKAQLRKQKEAVTTLPEDLHYDPTVLTRLFNKPDWSARHPADAVEQQRQQLARSGAEARDQFGAEEPVFSFNPDEELDDDFGAGFTFDDGFDPSGDGGASSSNVVIPHELAVALGPAGSAARPAAAAPAAPASAQLTSVAAKMGISYAKSAKMFDIKALKKGAWEIVRDVHAENVAENRVNDGMDFRTVLERVPAKVGGKAGEVSVPLAFICMLHLCNEKGVQLEQTGADNLTVMTNMARMED